MTDFAAKRRQPDSSELSRWFHAACRRQPGALQQLLALYRPLMLKLAHQRLSKSIQAKVAPSDLVQATLWKATRAFSDETFADRVGFRAWLVTILANEAASAGRRYGQAQKRDVSREQSLSSPETQVWIRRISASLSKSDASATFARERVDDVLSALATLPSHYQLTLRLRYFEKLNFEAIGKKLERSADAARVLHNRALVKLRERLRVVDQPTDNSESPT